MATANPSVPKLTVASAIDQIGLGKFQYRVMALVGLFWMADAMEIMLLSVLEPVLVCVWDISDVQVALLTTSVFLGMMLGSATFGMLGDKFGRKTALIQGSFFLTLYGLFSSVSPNYTWLMVLRFLVGFFMGTLPQVVVINTEMMPADYRMKAFILMCCFWSLGSILTVLLAMATLSYDHWGIFVVLCAVPPLLFLIGQYFWLPESPQFLQSKGRVDEAKAVIDRVANTNQSPLGTWMLRRNEEEENDISNIADKNVKQIEKAIDDNSNALEVSQCNGNDIASTSENKGLMEKSRNQEKSNLAELLSPDWIRTTLLLWFLLFYCSFSYYGVILISPGIINEQLCSAQSKDSTSSSCSITKCPYMPMGHYLELLWTTAAEIPMTLLLNYFSDHFGRRRMMVAGFLIVAVTSLGAGVCAVGHILQVLFLFLGRGSSVGVFNLATLYVSEVYPSHLRSSGMGFSFFWARVGGMTTPYIAQVLSKRSTMTSQSVYCAVGVVAAIATMFLQVETAGRTIK